MKISKTTADHTFNAIYRKLINELFESGTASTSRKGKKVVELFDKTFVLTNPLNCMAVCRDMSLDYLSNEFAFYMSGSNKLEDAVACSSFWSKCSDDGETINSNYGKLLFHDRNAIGNTQFEHAVNCLRNSRGSKKAVMTIYDKENAYISNDNPCTMFLRARMDDDNRLHMTVVMRSSDIYFGLPYDVPFFVFVQMAMVDALQDDYPGLLLGSYTHIANSLHYYEYKRKELLEAVGCGIMIEDQMVADETFERLTFEHMKTVRQLTKKDYMAYAWEASKDSKCLKKQVGCAFTINENGGERLLVTAHGGVQENRTPCTHCSRDNVLDDWYGDECPSIHAEMRALNRLRLSCVDPDWSKVNVYVTHNCCDACAKLLNMLGVRQVYYDKPYKINEAHWPTITFTQIKDK